jgi:hypothetical protein
MIKLRCSLRVWLCEERTQFDGVVTRPRHESPKNRALQIYVQFRTAEWKLNDRTEVRLEARPDGYRLAKSVNT